MTDDADDPDERGRNATPNAAVRGAARSGIGPRSAPPPGLAIRAAEPEDAPAIARLANMPGFRRGTMRPPYQSVADTRAAMERGEMGGGANRASILAVLNGEIVGSAGLTRFAGRRAHVGTLGMGVDDAHAGRGIGTALLAELLRVADDWWGLRRIELEVYADNVPALRLYERAGFRREGVLRGYAMREGALLDALAMARLRDAPLIVGSGTGDDRGEGTDR